MRRLALALALLAWLAAPASAQIITYAPPQGAITADGTAAAPAHSYSADTDTGSFRIGADNEGFSAGGVLRWDYNTTRILSTIPVQAPAGSAAAPAFTFSGGTGKGIYATGASTLGLVANTVSFISDTSDFTSVDMILGTSTTAAILQNFSATGSIGATSGTQTFTRFSSGFNPASGTPTDIPFLIDSTINWSGTPGAGSYEALRISITETALPTGSNYLVRLLAGAGGATFRGGIRNTGQWESGGTAPSLSACGTTPAIVGTDVSGKVTVGTGVTTSCTVTFANTWANAPPCTVSGDNTAVGYIATSTTTVLTLTSSADMASDVLSYICLGRN